MPVEKAKEIIPGWSASLPEQKKRVGAHMDSESFKRRYGILIIAMAVFTIYTICLTAWVQWRTEQTVREEMAFKYASELEIYKAQQAEAQQAEHWLSGDASREAAINKAVDAVAPVIARLKHDKQKQTEVGIMLARVMNSAFPGSFEDVAGQDLQWPLYDGKNRTYTQHDRELAEEIIRPYMESGILPLDLTDKYCWAEWSENDLVARDSYEVTSSMHTWVYHG